MPLESYSLVEHFDFMCKYIPQPFAIKSADVKSFEKDTNDGGSYVIKTNNNTYSLSKIALKKLVDALGVKVRLLDAVCSETDVIDLALPIINKLFKCFADCFVFYSTSEDVSFIIDLNVHSERGEEGTIFECGPSPWPISITDYPNSFTCFHSFKERYNIEDKDMDILVKSDDIISGNKVLFNTFKNVSDSVLQPMLTFTSKFSDLDGFSDIHTTLYDEASDIYMQFPSNYAKLDDVTFDDLWKKALHINDRLDLNDFIFQEVSELAASEDTPNSVKKFISSILIDNTININQPIKDILAESVTICNQLKPSKARKLKRDLGNLIAWAVCMKHSGCSECHHLHI